jgi:YVTN family beta-propeller protein
MKKIALLLSLAISAQAGNNDHGISDALAAEAQAFAPAFIVPTGPAPTATTRSTVGEWGPVINWTPHLPVTAATLPDGRLLTFSSNQRTTFPGGAEFTYAAVWNPATGAFTEINNPRHDMFCGGTAMLPDGRVVINGGRNTTRLSSIFDWRTNQWTAMPNMNDPRWYNTSVALTDGSVFTVTGDGGTNTAERWVEASGWGRLSNINWATVVAQPGYVTRWHPLIVVAPDNRLFHGGPTDEMNWITTTGNGSLTFANANVPGAHFPKEGSFAIYNEGRIVVFGGSANTNTNPSDGSTGTSTNLAFTIDIRGAQPVVAATSSMKFVRQFCNSVILPNGEVMVIGGNSSGLKFNDTGSILAPEIWNPTTGQWREVTDMAIPRNYHSLALLLPDGRVWSGGSGLSGNSADHRDAQLYTPPMLFNSDGSSATRPTMSAAPSSIGPGQVFNVQGSAGITRFTFIKMSSQTHSMNTDLRFLELPFTSPSSGSYQITAHSNLSVMTPGYWMLFGLNAQGAYSTARIIQVSANNAPSLANPGSQTTPSTRTASLQLIATGNGTLTYSATGLPTGLSINATTGLISGTVSAAPAVFNVAASVQSSLGFSSSVSFTWTVVPATLGSGTILREWWLNIGTGNAISNLTSLATYPNSPSGTDQPTSFEAPTNWADGYGTRMRGWVHAAVTGQYRFWIASDDNGSLLLSTNDNPANAVQIASVTDWTDSRQWTKFPSQVSTLITLQAGQRYYIEALMKEGIGGDNLAVGWQPPGAAGPEVIPGTQLSPWVPNRLPSVTNPGARSNVIGSVASLQIQASDADADGLAYSATGLPTGLSIQSTSGLITGTPTASGSFNVIVSVTDNKGSPSTASFTWTIVPALVLNRPTTTARPVNTAVTFTATSTGGVNTRYRWNFGDGSATTAYSSNATASRTYAAPGRYLVTLEATDDSAAVRNVTFYQVIHAALTARKPSVSSNIVLEDLAAANDRVWVVNQDADTVSVFDAVTRNKLAETVVGSGPRSVAIAPDGRAWVTNVESSTISILSGTNYTVAATVTLPRGSRPFGIAFDPVGTAAFVALEGSGQLLKLNPTTGAQISNLNVGQHARHVSVNADGTRVYVSRFITPALPGENTLTLETTGRGGEVIVVTGGTLAIERSILLQHSEKSDSPTSARGIPNYLGATALSPDGLSAWVPSKQDNIKRGTARNGVGLNHDQTLRAISSRIDLTTQTEDYPSRVDYDNAGMPSAAIHDPWGGYVFVALESSRAVAVIDAYNKEIIARFDVGRAPQGLAISPDGLTLFVHNFMDRTVGVFNVSSILSGGSAQPTSLATLASVATEKLTATVLKGKQLFYDALDNRVALQEYMSCASCHNDGGHDGRVWDLTGFGEGLRNTITLRGHGNHGMLHWTGNFDEVQDFEGQIRSLAGGLGLMTDAQFNTGTRNQPLGDPKANVSADLDALAAYVKSLTTESRSPFRNADGTLTAAAVSGEVVFRQQNCASCHSGATFTNSALNVFRDIGTIKPTSGKRLNGSLTGFDVPTLRGLWATAPYLHDGSVSSLSAAVTAHQGTVISAAELNNLVAYLQQIDDAPAAAPTPVTVQLTTTATSPVTAAFTVSATFSHPVSGFTLSDITISGGTSSALTGTGGSYTFTVTPTANVTISLAANIAQDAAALGNLASDTLNFAYNAPVNASALVGQDVGAPLLSGSTAFDSATSIYTLTGSGAEIFFDHDDFQFAATTLTGDGSITARVRSLTNTNPWAKAGVMIRESSATGSRHALACITPPAAGNGFGMVSRTALNAAADYTGGPALNASPNNWVRLVRAGNVLTSFTSANGTAWTQLGAVTLTSLTNQVFIGLAVCSTDDSLLATGVFDNVQITGSTGGIAPSASLTSTSAIEAGAFNVRAQFSQAVTGLTLSDFIVTNGAASNLSGTGTTYNVTITPLAAGAVTIRLPASAVVNAANVASTASNTLSVTFSPPINVSLVGQDVGSVQLAGSTSFNSSTGTYTVQGAGAEIFFTADGFQYALTQLSGDGEIRARVTSQTNSNPWAKAGVMFRENLTAGSRHATVFTTPIAAANGFGVVSRTTANGASNYVGGPAVNAAPNNWVRLVRSGNVLTAFSSANGNTWATISTITLSNLTSSLYVGLAVTSATATQLSTATFDNVQIVGSLTAVAPAVTLSSASAVESGSFTVQARFTQAVTGLTPSDFNVINGNASNLTGSGTTYSIIITPTLAGNVSVSLPAAAAVNAGNVASVASNTVSVTYAPPSAISLTGRDIGAVGLAGNTSLNTTTGTYTLNGAGDEIFFSADAFHFAAAQLTGDGEIRARVTGLTNTGAWAKAGVMIRENLTAGSRHALLCSMPAVSGNGTGLIWRPTANAAATFQYGPPLNPAPNNWLRLVRTGNVISSFASANGTTWTSIQSTTFTSLPATLYVGLAVTATDTATLATGTFDNVQIVGVTAPGSTPTTPASATTGGGSSTPIIDTDFDGDDVHDLIEYVLGDDEIYSGGWWLTTMTGGRIDAHLAYLASIADVTFTLEYSSDLTNWTPLPLASTVSDLGGGIAQRTWSGITSLQGQSVQRGLLRLRFTHNSGLSVTSAPQAWQQLSLGVGTQSVGISLVNAPVYAGFTATVIGSNAVRLAAHGALSIDPTFSYYLEVRDGAHAGHRYDITRFDAEVITLNLASPNTTQTMLPADIAGARVFVRPHVTLGQVFPKTTMTGGTRSTSADQVLFHNGTSWDTYWLNQTATRLQWVRTGDAALSSRDNQIIPPGTGVMSKVLRLPKTMTLTGYVRQTPFRRILKTGHNFLALPRPVDSTPNQLDLTTAGGFISSSRQTSADQLLLWAGDTKLGATTYTTYWLQGITSAANWVLQTDAKNTSVNDRLKLPANKAFFLKTTPTSTPKGWFND